MIEDVDEATEHLLCLFSVRYEKCFPEKRQQMRNDNKLWMTTQILNFGLPVNKNALEHHWWRNLRQLVLCYIDYDQKNNLA